MSYRIEHNLIRERFHLQWVWDGPQCFCVYPDDTSEEYIDCINNDVGNPLTPIAWPNSAFDYDTEKFDSDLGYVNLFIEDEFSRNASMGAHKSDGSDDNITRYNGTVIVQVFTRKAVGDMFHLCLVDRVHDIFRRWLGKDATTGIIVRFREPPFAVPVTGDLAWYQHNVLCPFERDSFG